MHLIYDKLWLSFIRRIDNDIDKIYNAKQALCDSLRLVTTPTSGKSGERPG